MGKDGTIFPVQTSFEFKLLRGMMENLLEGIPSDSLNKKGLSWDHPPLAWNPLVTSGIQVQTAAKVDYFRSPKGDHVSDNGHFLWTSWKGDFLARGLVRPTFQSTYDSGVLMVRENEQNWAKLCFEKTDFGTTAAVSVVTRGYSDDANGADIDATELWLQAARVGDLFAFHYSLDGKNWRMVRFFRLEMQAEVKVGLVAQCPAGSGTTIDFLHFSIGPMSLKSIRTGT